VNLRFLIFCSALLVMVRGALADGAYQRTKDGKTLIWNSNPKPGDIATWSGRRDAEGYASGFGTLSWYSAANISADNKPVLYGRYFGNMVRGKWHSQVNAHARGKTAHAAFVDGNRISGWIPGAAPTWGVAQKSRQAVGQTPTEPESPAQGPPSAPDRRKREVVRSDSITKPEPPTKRPPPTAPPSQMAEPSVSQATGNKAKHDELDGSLRALFEPPSSLRANSMVEVPVEMNSPPQPSAAATASSSGHIVLSEAEVVELAGAEASAQGYDMNKYELRQVRYNASDDIWSVLYYERPADGRAEHGKTLTVSVEDKAKKPSVMPEK
jgi:hypothetical protein